jgi:hypothetical protein
MLVRPSHTHSVQDGGAALRLRRLPPLLLLLLLLLLVAVMLLVVAVMLLLMVLVVVVMVLVVLVVIRICTLRGRRKAGAAGAAGAAAAGVSWCRHQRAERQHCLLPPLLPLLLGPAGDATRDSRSTAGTGTYIIGDDAGARSRGHLCPFVVRGRGGTGTSASRTRPLLPLGLEEGAAAQRGAREGVRPLFRRSPLRAWCLVFRSSSERFGGAARSSLGAWKSGNAGIDAGCEIGTVLRAAALAVRLLFRLQLPQCPFSIRVDVLPLCRCERWTRPSFSCCIVGGCAAAATGWVSAGFLVVGVSIFIVFVIVIAV